MAHSIKAPSLRRTAASLWQSLTRDLFDHYRPEMHYMRGPGPRWHAKHAQPVTIPVELTSRGAFHA